MHENPAPAPFPAPLCDLCGVKAGCLGADFVRPEFPRCHRAFRNAPMGRVRQFTDEWFAPGDRPPEAAAALNRVLARLAIERQFSSELFEPSVSWDDTGEHLARFAYALPSFWRAPANTARWALTFGADFGASTAEVFRRLLARVQHPCVEQLLVGAAFDTPQSWRAKLYVQFRDSHAADALKLAGALTAIPDLTRRSPDLPLHLLCLDVGPAGIRGAKLYFLIRRIGPKDRVWHQDIPLLDGLWRAGLPELSNVLSIHRVNAPDDPGFERASEIDFHLGENRLRWSELAHTDALRPAVRELRGYERLARRYDLAVRRLSVAAGPTTKLNLYLAVAEQQPPVAD